eukprot:CAMPEP_0115213154 /NCGR_PEP_ID=MMETSP0270-20121206/23650_1 /TAXON_ID=71861 /ORGANISM="Scrippsiella trochoidea, Strain CCMP3099" /LENGTH=62 /DNA_ID=CAMNT_0002626899 /DNA_START=71 /DNA_END=259 /DNA_ORIENTATION=-
MAHLSFPSHQEFEERTKCIFERLEDEEFSLAVLQMVPSHEEDSLNSCWPRFFALRPARTKSL